MACDQEENIYDDLYNDLDVAETPDPEELLKKIEELSELNKELNARNSELAKNNKVLEKNFYCLLNAAQQETRRKDDKIKELSSLKGSQHQPCKESQQAPAVENRCHSLITDVGNNPLQDVPKNSIIKMEVNNIRPQMKECEKESSAKKPSIEKCSSSSTEKPSLESTKAVGGIVGSVKPRRTKVEKDVKEDIEKKTSNALQRKSEVQSNNKKDRPEKVSSQARPERMSKENKSEKVLDKQSNNKNFKTLRDRIEKSQRGSNSKRSSSKENKPDSTEKLSERTKSESDSKGAKEENGKRLSAKDNRYADDIRREKERQNREREIERRKSRYEESLKNRNRVRRRRSRSRSPPGDRSKFSRRQPTYDKPNSRSPLARAPRRVTRRRQYSPKRSRSPLPGSKSIVKRSHSPRRKRSPSPEHWARSPRLSPEPETFPDLRARPRNVSVSQKKECPVIAHPVFSDTEDAEPGQEVRHEDSEKEEGEMSSNDEFEDASEQQPVPEVPVPPVKTLYSIRSELRLQREAEEERKRLQEENAAESCEKRESRPKTENITNPVRTPVKEIEEKSPREDTHQKSIVEHLEKKPNNSDRECEDGEITDEEEPKSSLLPTVTSFSPFKELYKLTRFSPVKQCKLLMDRLRQSQPVEPKIENSSENQKKQELPPSQHRTSRESTKPAVDIPDETMDVLSEVLSMDTLTSILRNTEGQPASKKEEARMAFMPEMPTKPLSRTDLISSSSKGKKEEEIAKEESPKEKIQNFDLKRYKIPKKQTAEKKSSVCLEKEQSDSRNKRSCRKDSSSNSKPRSGGGSKSNREGEVKKNTSVSPQEIRRKSEPHKTVISPPDEKRTNEHKDSEPPKYDMKKLVMLGLISPEKDTEPENPTNSPEKSKEPVERNIRKRKPKEQTRFEAFITKKSKPSNKRSDKSNSESPESSKICSKKSPAQGSNKSKELQTDRDVGNSSRKPNSGNMSAEKQKINSKPKSETSASNGKSERSPSKKASSHTPSIDEVPVIQTLTDVDEQFYQLLDIMDESGIAEGLSVTAKISKTMDEVVQSLQSPPQAKMSSPVKVVEKEGKIPMKSPVKKSFQSPVRSPLKTDRVDNETVPNEHSPGPSSEGTPLTEAALKNYSVWEGESFLPHSSSSLASSPKQDSSNPSLSSSGIENFEMFKDTKTMDTPTKGLGKDLALSDASDSEESAFSDSDSSDYPSDASDLVNQLF